MATKASTQGNDEQAFREAWLAFVNSHYFILVPGKDESRDHLLTYREKVYGLVRSEAFVSAFGSCFGKGAPEDWNVESDERVTQLRALLLEELQALTRMAQAVEGGKPSKRIGRWFGQSVKPLLSRSSTAVGSLKDMAELWTKENIWVKSGLSFFKELFDFAKG